MWGNREGGGKKAEPWSPSPASPDASGSPPLREHRPPDEALLTPRSLRPKGRDIPPPPFQGGGQGCGDGARTASFFLFSFREEENTSLYEEFRGEGGGPARRPSSPILSPPSPTSLGYALVAPPVSGE